MAESSNVETSAGWSLASGSWPVGRLLDTRLAGFTSAMGRLFPSTTERSQRNNVCSSDDRAVIVVLVLRAASPNALFRPASFGRTGGAPGSVARQRSNLTSGERHQHAGHPNQITRTSENPDLRFRERDPRRLLADMFRTVASRRSTPGSSFAERVALWLRVKAQISPLESSQAASYG